MKSEGAMKKTIFLPYVAKVEIENFESDQEEDIAVMKTKIQLDNFLVYFETVGGMKVTARLNEVK